jgi:orotate phosphoribosyltransferase
MTQEEIIKVFQKTDALLQGHFLLSSGLHSTKYFQCALVLQYPHYTSLICKELVHKFKDEKIDVVVGLAYGGIIVSYEMARYLKVCSLFTERVEGKMTLRRGFCLRPKERAIVVEDVVTTGGSVKEVIALINNLEAKVIGVGAIVDRSGRKADFGVEYKSLVELDIENFRPNECPLCKQGIPLVKPGSR